MSRTTFAACRTWADVSRGPESRTATRTPPASALAVLIGRFRGLYPLAALPVGSVGRRLRSVARRTQASSAT